MATNPNSSDEKDARYITSNYLKNRKRLSSTFFEIALPNEYLIEVGKRDVKPALGVSRFRLFKKFIRVPASVQTLYFKTDNANTDYQGIGVEGFASWRIDPVHPEIAIRTLDFFDENDPMSRTNSELKTICVEAVRHVIANMSIDDALKKKDEIGENLKKQLQEVEKKWGIVFDQVGIEKVAIMSATLFEQLQSQFRDSLRLEVEKKRIVTEREIARENNAMREKNSLETMETDKKINLVNVENQALVQKNTLEENFKTEQKKREIQEKLFTDEIRFKIEKENQEHNLKTLNLTLELQRQKNELDLIKAQKEVELLKAEIELKALEIRHKEKLIDQTYSQESLTEALIARLPELFSNVKIDNYSVMSGGNDAIHPISKLVSEVVTILQNSQILSAFSGSTEPKSK